MPEYREVKGTVKVPAETGIEGFLHTIRTLLRRPRLQHLEVDARGTVSFRRFALEGENDGTAENNFGVDLDALQPYHVVRNSKVSELVLPLELPTAVIVGIMFDRAAKERLHPLAFVVSPTTVLWQWYYYTTGHLIEEQTTFFGLPVLSDRHIPETALLLCVGYGKDAGFVDTRVTYKVEMPPPESVPVEEGS